MIESQALCEKASSRCNSMGYEHRCWACGSSFGSDPVTPIVGDSETGDGNQRIAKGQRLCSDTERCRQTREANGWFFCSWYIYAYCRPFRL